MNIKNLINEINGEVIGKESFDTTKIFVDFNIFSREISKLVNINGFFLSLLFATDDRKEKGKYGIHAIISLDNYNEWLHIYTEVSENEPKYESLTKYVMASHWYERYIHDMFGIVPEGHPDLRRLVHHENIPNNTFPLRKDFKCNTKLNRENHPYPMHHVDGEGVYEIPVGPIHAGIIEPGHFRFNVAGERIITLEGKLFFKHKGVEKLIENKNIIDAIPFVERVSGDTAVGHTLAFCHAVETITNTKISEISENQRGLILELERITMHLNDIANIGGMGTGFSVIAVQGFRLKEEMMRLSNRIFGHRFFRGFVIPGGCSKKLNKEELNDIFTTVNKIVEDVIKLVEFSLESDSFCDRLETTGVLSKEAGIAYGALGIAARGSGIDRDIRKDHPYGIYREIPFNSVNYSSGDVYGRYMVRYGEFKESLKIITKIIHNLKNFNGDDIKSYINIKDGSSLGYAEGWRGEILHWVKLKDGVIDRIVIRDPSFCNWALFGELGPGNIVPDFPICNKSLNLSYSGTDL